MIKLTFKALLLSSTLATSVMAAASGGGESSSALAAGGAGAESIATTGSIESIFSSAEKAAVDDVLSMVDLSHLSSRLQHQFKYGILLNFEEECVHKDIKEKLPMILRIVNVAINEITTAGLSENELFIMSMVNSLSGKTFSQIEKCFDQIMLARSIVHSLGKPLYKDAFLELTGCLFTYAPGEAPWASE